MHYNRYRYYSPYVGRFISKDPVGLFGGLNAYQYAPNSNFWVDLLGLKGVTVKPAPANSPFDYYLTLDSKVYPETAGHIKEAIMKKGKASIVTYEPVGAEVRRRAAMKGHPCKKGYDRDEWSMAMFKEGGTGASVKYINPSDNKGAGKSIQLGIAGAGALPGDRIKFFVK